MKSTEKLIKERIKALEEENEKLKDENGVLKLKLEECKAGCKRFYEDKIEIQHRIDKAIFYMEDGMINQPFTMYKVDQIDVRKLLQILKGE